MHIKLSVQSYQISHTFGTGVLRLGVPPGITGLTILGVPALLILLLTDPGLGENNPGVLPFNLGVALEVGVLATDFDNLI